MNWIDAHAHLTDPRIANELPAMLDECAKAGIDRFVLGGVDPEDWERQKVLAEKYPKRVFCSFGLHPWWVADHADAELTLKVGLKRLGTELKYPERSCVAVGEMGLDFHPRFPESTHAVQARLFRDQLRLALSSDLPIVLHVVRAHEETIRILEEEFRAASKTKWRGIVHSFADEPRIAQAYLALGLTPSISAAVITRGKGSGFEKLKQTMVTLSAKDYVLETDAPDQPPYPRAEGAVGKPVELNPPVNLIRVAEAVARIRNQSAAEVLDQSRDNVVRIFGI